MKIIKYKILLLLIIMFIEIILLFLEKHLTLKDFRGELYAILFAFLEYKDRVEST